MYPAQFDYFCPESVEEVLELLERHGEEAKLLAGGQSLIPLMKLRIASPRLLVDINRIPSLGGIREENGRLAFGALCRHAELASSAMLREKFPILHDGASLIADVQVRNRGTVGGSLVHADPAGDWGPILIALGAEVELVSRKGSRWVPLENFVTDAYTTELLPEELLTGVRVPLPEGPGGAYVKFEKRAGDFAVASVGVQLQLDEEGLCRKIAIGLGAVGPTAIRARQAEMAFSGKAPSEAAVAECERLVREAAQPFEDTRGSVEYKRHLVGVLFRRVFEVALRRAQGERIETLHL